LPDVLVTGGTGALGRQVVKKLREAGHRAIVMSRRPGPTADRRQADLATGAGLEQAVRGVEAIIHAGSATTRPWRYHITDVEGTRRLIGLAKQAGVRHLVYVSIVGMEGVSYPYYRHKLAAEAVVKEGAVPWSILRATQFHTLLDIFLTATSRIPGVLLVPFEWKLQPVDTRDVAARLVEVVESEPAGMLPDYGGPEVRAFKSCARSWLEARKLRRKLVNLPLPFAWSRQMAAGSLLCPERAEGTITWEQFLKARYGSALP
jgi:uncharacterized protein YbjT (DUF2867 family)